MAQPIDYSLNVPSPLEAGAQAFKLGAGIAAAEEQARAYQQERQMAALQQQQAMEQERAANEAINAALDPNATWQQITRAQFFTKNKEQMEALANWGKTLDLERAKPMVNRLLMVAGPLASNNPKVAIANLKREFAANEGNPAAQAEIQSRMDEINADPAAAASRSMAELALLPGGDQAVTNLLKLTAEQRAQLQEKRAAAQDIRQAEMQGWNITKLQSDMRIAQQNANIAAMNARIASEGNQIKRRELVLKVQEMEQKRDESVRAKLTEASTAAAQSDNLLNTVEKALKMSTAGKDKFGKPIFTGTITSATGPVSSRMPTISQDVADFEETIDTLGSQITMSRIGEMKGALSDKDLATLKSSLQSLSLRQSPERLVENLFEIQRLTQKARKTTMDKFGAPASLSIPDTPAAEPSPTEIDSLLKKYGG